MNQKNTKRILSKGFFCLLLILPLPTPSLAQAKDDTSMREFIMSCTYGVLAGTLVGSAMLAFTDQPGENLNKVARGASIGLYSGILLGLYVVYVVPGQVPTETEPDFYNGPGANLDLQWKRPNMAPRFALAPEWDFNRVDGLSFRAQVLEF